MVSLSYFGGKQENVLNLICCYSIAKKTIYFRCVSTKAITIPTNHTKTTVKITTLNAFDVGQLKTKAQQKENKSRLEQKGALARKQRKKQNEARQKFYASE